MKGHHGGFPYPPLPPTPPPTTTPLEFQYNSCGILTRNILCTGRPRNILCTLYRVSKKHTLYTVQGVLETYCAQGVLETYFEQSVLETYCCEPYPINYPVVKVVFDKLHLRQTSVHFLLQTKILFKVSA